MNAIKSLTVHQTKARPKNTKLVSSQFRYLTPDRSVFQVFSRIGGTEEFIMWLSTKVQFNSNQFGKELKPSVFCRRPEWKKSLTNY